LLRKILWSDFEARSSRIIVRLKKHRDLVDIEANVCHVIESKTARNYEYSHRELLECLEVIKWLSPADAEGHFERLLRSREIGTGLWFLAKPMIVSWMTSSSKLLWVGGIPG